MFAVPIVSGQEAKGSAKSSLDSFLLPITTGCTPASLTEMVPGIKDPASVLTTTRTSFTSLLRSNTANPSPSAIPPNPVVSATTPIHRQNDFKMTHSDIASPNPIPPQVSHSALDSALLPASLPTLVLKPQSAGPQHQSSQHNINAPGKLDS